jgi:hypothetical protein
MASPGAPEMLTHARALEVVVMACVQDPRKDTLPTRRAGVGAVHDRNHDHDVIRTLIRS